MKNSHKLFLKVLITAALLIFIGGLLAMAGSKAIEMVGIVLIVLGIVTMSALYLWWWLI